MLARRLRRPVGCRMGANCKLQNYALVDEPAVLEDGGFVGPAVVFTNDVHPPRRLTGRPAQARGDDWEIVAVTCREGASIGARSVCVAPVTIGRWALVAAGSVRDQGRARLRPRRRRAGAAASAGSGRGRARASQPGPSADQLGPARRRGRPTPRPAACSPRTRDEHDRPRDGEVATDAGWSRHPPALSGRARRRRPRPWSGAPCRARARPARRRSRGAAARRRCW